MKKILSIILILMFLVIFSNVTFAETQKYNITLKKVEIIDRSDTSIGNQWDKHIKVGDKELVIDQEIQEASLNYYINFTEKDDLPDIAEKEGILNVGSNKIVVPVYEYRSYGMGEPKVYTNIYAKWEIIINVEQIISPTQTNMETTSPSKINTEKMDSTKIMQTNITDNLNTPTSKLPKTGENDNGTIILVGLCFISVGVGISIFSRIGNIN